MENRFSNLINKFHEIYKRGWIKSNSNDFNSVGNTFEELLGKKMDEFSYPDYDGIEIKCQRVDTSYPFTLFGLAPWGESVPEIERIRRKYGYFDFDPDDKKKINAEFLYDKNILICNRYYFNLDICVAEEKIYLVIYDYNHNLLERISYWSFSDIKEKLNVKLQYMAYIYSASQKFDGVEYFKYFRMECYQNPSFDKFLDLIRRNIISVSFTTSSVKYGPSEGKMKASVYFRIHRGDIIKLFEKVCVEDLSGNKDHL